MSKNHDLVKLTYCPTCGYQLDDATDITMEDQPPRPGDVSICFNCGELLTFTPDMGLQPTELNDLMSLEEDQRQMLDRAMRKIKARGRIPEIERGIYERKQQPNQIV